jgi:hypothetical protein
MCNADSKSFGMLYCTASSGISLSGLGYLNPDWDDQIQMNHNDTDRLGNSNLDSDILIWNQISQTRLA